MDNTLWATIILSIVGFIITAYYSRHTQKIADEQLLKQLFTEFNLRYDDLNNYLIEIEKHYPTLELLDKSERAELLKQKVIDYFILCSEEFYWYYHKHRIDKIIWHSWHAGMNYWYNEVPVIKYLWEKEIEANGEESYYIINKEGFFKQKKVIHNNGRENNK